MQRIGIIGDIHAESATLEKVLDFLGDSNIDGLLSVGDIVDGKGNVDKCCELLTEYGVSTVRGNHDRWFLTDRMRDLRDATRLSDISHESREYISRLPVTRQYETPRGKLLLCHGMGENDMAKLTPYDFGYAVESNIPLQNLVLSGKFRFVINGHSHINMVRTIGGLTVINAGTLRPEEDPCFVIADFARNIVRFYRADTDIFCKEELPL